MLPVEVRRRRLVPAGPVLAGRPRRTTLGVSLLLLLLLGIACRHIPHAIAVVARAPVGTAVVITKLAAATATTVALLILVRFLWGIVGVLGQVFVYQVVNLAAVTGEVIARAVYAAIRFFVPEPCWRRALAVAGALVVADVTGRVPGLHGIQVRERLGLRRGRCQCLCQLIHSLGQEADL